MEHLLCRKFWFFADFDSKSMQQATLSVKSMKINEARPKPRKKPKANKNPTKSKTRSPKNLETEKPKMPKNKKLKMETRKHKN